MRGEVIRWMSHGEEKEEKKKGRLGKEPMNAYTLGPVYV
jgi:hypothetical protein